MSKDEALKLALEALEDLGMKHFESTDEVLYKETFTAIKEALMSVPDGAQPEQEPVAWMNDMGTHIDLNVSGRGTPLYITPPQRTWVNATTWRGLTDEEILAVNMSTVTKLIDEPIVCDTDHNIVQLGKAIEAKLKAKNSL